MLTPEAFCKWICRSSDSFSPDEEKDVVQLILGIPSLIIDGRPYADQMRNLDPRVLWEEVAQCSGYIQSIELFVRMLGKIGYRRLDEIAASDLIKHIDLFDKDLKRVFIVLNTLRILKYKYNKNIMVEFALVLHRYIPDSDILYLASAIYMIADAGVNLKGEDLNALYKRIEAEADTIDAEILMDYLE